MFYLTFAVLPRNLERLKTIADLPDVFVVSPRKSLEPNTSFVKELIVKIRSRSGIQRFTMKYVIVPFYFQLLM